MFEKILIPLDGSELAEKALIYGEEFGRRLGSEIILFHVCSPEHGQFERMHKIYLDNQAETLAREMREGQPANAKVNVTAKIDGGKPSEAICNLVEKEKIGLIIMTTAGVSGHKFGIIGSVADNVSRTVIRPTMLINPRKGIVIDKRQIINRILVPLDGSDLSKLALPLAEELAARLKVPITLFQMARNYASIGEPAPFVDYAKLTEDEEKKIRVEMTGLEKKLKEKGLAVTWSLTSGTDAAQEIINASEKIGAGLVVISTHGRSGLGKWVFGSVTEKVIRHGEAPLLLVHARAGQAS